MFFFLLFKEFAEKCKLKNHMKARHSGGKSHELADELLASTDNEGNE